MRVPEVDWKLAETFVAHTAAGRDAGGGGGALDLLAVLVGAGEEEGFDALRSGAAGEDVRHDGGVGVADVGARVDVVDGGREEEFLRRFWHFALRVKDSREGRPRRKAVGRVRGEL